MFCLGCREEKLRHDFPPEGPTKQCRHAAQWCLKCVLSSIDGAFGAKPCCPQCKAELDYSESQELAGILRQGDCLVFRDLEEIQKSELETATTLVPQSGSIEIALLDGRRISIELTRTTTMRQLKELIQQRLGVGVSEQRIMHCGQEFKGDDLMWKDSKVKYGSVLQLVVVMYETGSLGDSVGGNVRELVFELSWIWQGAINHLNGSCIVLGENRQFLYSTDFLHLAWMSIWHHGRSSKQSPKQQITVTLSGVGADASYLFFTLSAYAPGGVTLQNFLNPKVDLRDARTAAPLATYIAAQANYDEAVVLCCAKRDRASDTWRVQRVGSTSSGNVKCPTELIESVQRIAGGEGLI